jgi:CRISPR-associated protein Cas5h
MATQKLVSFDLRADFGFFKKPDYNDGLLLSYNMLHKPALLGILGAVIGLAGYQKKGEFPEYYQKLKDLPIGIEPLDGYHDKGNFQKTSVKYTNTVGYANTDGNLLVEESMLIRPAYRCYVLLDLEITEQGKLYEYLRDGKAEFIPYLGKNEFQAWWCDENGENTFKEYAFEKFDYTADFQVNSVFVREDPIRDRRVVLKPSFRTRNEVQRVGSFTYFERLPFNFHENLFQYVLYEFAYSDWLFTKDSTIDGLFKIKDSNGKITLIQLFV